VARTPTIEQEKSFDLILGQLETLWSGLASGLPEAVRSISVAENARRIRSVAGYSAAMRGAKQALNDALEAYQYASADDVKAANSRLAAVGSPPLHVLLAARTKTVRRVLKQRQLNSETEYYLLREILLDAESELSADNRALGESMLEKYESIHGLNSRRHS